MDRAPIYTAIEEMIADRNPPNRKEIKDYLLDLDLTLCAAKMVYYDSEQDSREALKFVLALAAASVLALEAHGIPKLE